MVAKDTKDGGQDARWTVVLLDHCSSVIRSLRPLAYFGLAQTTGVYFILTPPAFSVSLVLFSASSFHRHRPRKQVCSALLCSSTGSLAPTMQ